MKTTQQHLLEAYHLQNFRNTSSTRNLPSSFSTRTCPSNSSGLISKYLHPMEWYLARVGSEQARRSIQQIRSEGKVPRGKLANGLRSGSDSSGSTGSLRSGLGSLGSRGLLRSSWASCSSSGSRSRTRKGG